MDDKKDKALHLHIQTEELAIPEVTVEEEEEPVAGEKAEDSQTRIDYSGAIPEIHFKRS